MNQLFVGAGLAAYDAPALLICFAFLVEVFVDGWNIYPLRFTIYIHIFIAWEIQRK